MSAENGNTPAFPDQGKPGMTKRECMAAMVLAGMAAPGGAISKRHASLTAKDAVALVDALQEELEKE